MLEHQKRVLKGVSDNERLFKKELKKSLSWLSEDDQILLKEWMITNFMDRHPGIIHEVLIEKKMVMFEKE